MLIIVEAHIGQIEFALPFDVDLVGSVDQDIVHVLVPEQRLERTKPEQFVLDFLDQPGAVNFGKQAPFFVEDLGDRLRHLGRSHTGLETLQARHVEGLEQPVMHCELELLEAVGQHVALARFGRVRSH